MQIKELDPSGVPDLCGVALCYVVAVAAAWEALPSASGLRSIVAHCMQLDCSILLRQTLLKGMRTVKSGVLLS